MTNYKTNINNMNTITTGEFDGEPIVRAKTSFDTIEQALAKLPSSRINNSRSIVRKKIERFDKFPSEMRQREIEDITGLTGDFLEKDHGEEPIKDNN